MTIECSARREHGLMYTIKNIQFDIQAAEDVIAVALARVALLNISTGIWEHDALNGYFANGQSVIRTAQDRGPRHDEKARLN